MPVAAVVAQESESVSFFHRKRNKVVPQVRIFPNAGSKNIYMPWTLRRCPCPHDFHLARPLRRMGRPRIPAPFAVLQLLLRVCALLLGLCIFVLLVYDSSRYHRSFILSYVTVSSAAFTYYIKQSTSDHEVDMLDTMHQYG